MRANLGKLHQVSSGGCEPKYTPELPMRRSAHSRADGENEPSGLGATNSRNFRLTTRRRAVREEIKAQPENRFGRLRSSETGLSRCCSGRVHFKYCYSVVVNLHTPVTTACTGPECIIQFRQGKAS
ncbi:unnamed protein product [Heligmosomoides polygyrus]|uniref:Uncharacterized protein n=1 Tax=Heligmosomoides polygyrus TaxID=6339 RepID=A0A183FM87_HELPZ|nr:unnamed protein product [Heligmosomoides polygyrus]